MAAVVSRLDVLVSASRAATTSPAPEAQTENAAASEDMTFATNQARWEYEQAQKKARKK